MATSLLASPLLGADRAPVELRPPAVYSLAGPAIELAARAGFVLEPWQADGLDIMMSVRADGKWAAFEYGEMCPRQNGKTAEFAVRALAGLLLLGERLIMWTAHEYKTALESFLLMQSILEELGEVTGPRRNLIDLGDGVVIKVNNTNGEEEFTRLPVPARDGNPARPRQRLKFLARSKGSGRGFSGDVNLIDEAFAYTSAHQSALMPTMTARKNPQICYASSPPLDSDTGEVLFALKARVEAGGAAAEGLGWRDWGLPDVDLGQLAELAPDERDELLDDRARWAATNPAIGRGRVTEESILRNRRAMKWADYARECLGVWPVAPEEGGRVIRAASWDALKDPSSTFEGAPTLAIDCTPGGTHTAIVASGRRDDGVVHLEVIEHRTGTGWVPERAKQLHERHEPGEWLIDPSGPAAMLVKPLKAAGIPLRYVTGRDYAGAYGEFVAAVKDAKVAHLGDRILDDAVAAGRKRDVGDGGFAWGRKNSEANIAPLVAATRGHSVAAAAVDPLDNIW